MANGDCIGQRISGQFGTTPSSTPRRVRNFTARFPGFGPQVLPRSSDFGKVSPPF